VNGSGAMLSPYLAIVVLLAVGAGIGLVNGLLIVKPNLRDLEIAGALLTGDDAVGSVPCVPG
jgi:hypothetical protein